jgi:hypothetical protein
MRAMCTFYGGKDGAKTVYISLVFVNYRNQTNMLLIIFLCVISTLTSVSGDCGDGNATPTDFEWYNVCTVPG